MQRLRSFLRVIDGISDWSGKIISFFIILTIFVVVWNVVMRYVFNSSAEWGQELTTGKISLAYVALGAAYALRYKSHINVDILYNRFSLRVRRIIDLCTSTLFFLFCVGLLWKAAEDSLKLHFSTRLFIPPSWPTSLLVVIGVSLLILQGLAKFIRDLVSTVTGKELA